MEAVAVSAKPILRVAALSGSLRNNSWHHGLIRAGTHAHILR
jgi:hypothetical protein